MKERSGRGALPVLVGLVLLTTGTMSLAQTDDPPPWKETSRDVYLDGRLDASVIVLRAPDTPHLAVLRDRADVVPLVIDTESLKLWRIGIAELTFGERGWEARTKGKLREVPRGAASRIDDSTLLLKTDPGYLIVASHAGVRGSTSRNEIFDAIPSWRELYERDEPDPDAVRTLAAIREDVRLTLALGTWCGDSKREVPRLLKALDHAANPRIALDIVALGGDFDEPMDVIRGRRLTNVPTLVVSREGEEIGRIVETPAGESMAADLASILTREPLHHAGRWARTERLARGRYSLVDASGAESGVEDWELFSDADGGILLHAFTDRQGMATEVWHRRDADGRTAFVEITRTDEPWHSRSRHWITARAGEEKHALQALTRGNGTGVIRQDSVLDAGTIVVSPCVSGAGRAALDAATSQGPATRSALILGGSGESATGRLGRVELGYRGVEPVTTPSGSFDANRISGRFDGAFVDGWLHPDLGIPIRWRRWGGLDAILTEFEMFERE